MRGNALLASSLSRPLRIELGRYRIRWEPRLRPLLCFLFLGMASIQGAQRQSAHYAVTTESFSVGGGSFSISYANCASLEPVVGISSRTIPDAGSIVVQHGFIGQLLPPLFPLADLAVTVVAPANGGVVGDTFTYSLIVTNRGPERVLGATIITDVSDNLTYLSSTRDALPRSYSGQLTFELFDLPPHATERIEVQMTAVAKGRARVDAHVIGEVAELIPADNSAEAGNTVLGVSGWRGTFGQDWFIRDNWSPPGVPGEFDLVVFNVEPQSSGTVRLDVDRTVGGLKFEQGYLYGAGALSIKFGAEWSGGQSKLALKVAESSILRLRGPQRKTAAQIENSGSIIWESGDLAFEGGGLNINPEALFDIQTDARLYIQQGFGLAAATIRNDGLIRKSAGPGTNIIGGQNSVTIYFENNGRVEVDSGQLSFGVQGKSRGVFTTRAGSVVDFPFGNFVFEDGTTFEGDGATRGTGARLHMNGRIGSSGFELAGGDLSGAWTNFGLLRWTAGRIFNTDLIIPSGSEFRLEGTAQKEIQDSVISIEGVLRFEGTGALHMPGVQINTRRSGLFEISSDAGIFIEQGFGRPSGLIQNDGIFRKGRTTGTTEIGGAQSVPIQFNNSGRVELDAGGVSLGSGGTSHGEFRCALGTLIQLPYGRHVFENGTTFSGQGAVRAIGADIVMDGDVTARDFELAGGGLFGAWTNRGLLRWRAGVIANSTLTIPPGGELRIEGSAHKRIQSSQIHNDGLLSIVGEGSVEVPGSTFENRSTGLLEIRSDARIFVQAGFGDPPGLFQNRGTFRKVNGSGTSRIGGTDSAVVFFENSGTVDLPSGVLQLSSLTLAANSILKTSLAGTNAGTQFGQVQVLGAATLDGILSFDLAEGFAPATADTFLLLTAQTRAGTFSSIAGPTIRSLAFEPLYQPNAVLLTVKAAHLDFDLVPRLSQQGHFQLSLRGEPGQTYIIESSRGLLTWQPVATNTLNSPLWEFVDPGASTHDFYRALLAR